MNPLFGSPQVSVIPMPSHLLAVSSHQAAGIDENGIPMKTPKQFIEIEYIRVVELQPRVYDIYILYFWFCSYLKVSHLKNQDGY